MGLCYTTNSWPALNVNIVETLNDLRYDVTFPVNATIQDLYEKAARLTHLPPSRLILFYGIVDLVHYPRDTLLTHFYDYAYSDLRIYLERKPLYKRALAKNVVAKNVVQEGPPGGLPF